MPQKEPKYIDIHSHVNFKAFEEDRDEVIKRALDAETWVINVGTPARYFALCRRTGGKK